MSKYWHKNGKKIVHNYIFIEDMSTQNNRYGHNYIIAQFNNE